MSYVQIGSNRVLLDTWDDIVAAAQDGLIDERAKKDRDDVGWVAHHLVSIHNKLRQRRNLTQTQLRYLRSVLAVVEQMMDADPARAVPGAYDINRRLEVSCSTALAARATRDPVHSQITPNLG